MLVIDWEDDVTGEKSASSIGIVGETGVVGRLVLGRAGLELKLMPK